MTNVSQAATAEFATATAPTQGWMSRLIGSIAVSLALLSALATFVVLANLTPILPTHEVVLTLLLVNAFTVLLLLAFIGREVWRVLQARRRGRAAARLHVRIVALFSLIAAVPAILVAVVASITLDRGLDHLLSTSTRAAMENSKVMADVYVRDQAENVGAHAVILANELGNAKRLFEQDRDQFHQRFSAVTANRGLAAAQIIDGAQGTIEKADTKVE